MPVSQWRRVSSFSMLTLAALALMASTAGAGDAGPDSLKKTSATAESITLKSTIAKTAPGKPDGHRLAKPDQASKRPTVAAWFASRNFERARSAFPGFCSEWERKLRERERKNLNGIQWKEQNGWKVGEFLGYSKIQTCTCKQSSRGQPLGILTYGEMNYYLTGKTIDEAKRATPKGTLATETTEIFRWGRNKWEY